jgi:photosynthetic reaction center H subunit
VNSIRAHQFAHVPQPASAEQVTRREEDKITAYFGSGHLYADPARQEPLV